jgi:hypothetical protein
VLLSQFALLLFIVVHHLYMYIERDSSFLARGGTQIAEGAAGEGSRGTLEEGRGSKMAQCPRMEENGDRKTSKKAPG